MKGVLPRVTMGRPALRAALVSIEMRAFTFFWKISESKAFWAPAAPEPSSATSSTTFLPMMPPLALISSAASSADCTTEGATTLLAPLRPTGIPILISWAQAADARLETIAVRIRMRTRPSNEAMSGLLPCSVLVSGAAVLALSQQ